MAMTKADARKLLDEFAKDKTAELVLAKVPKGSGRGEGGKGLGSMYKKKAATKPKKSTSNTTGIATDKPVREKKVVKPKVVKPKIVKPKTAAKELTGTELLNILRKSDKYLDMKDYAIKKAIGGGKQATVPQLREAVNALAIKEIKEKSPKKPHKVEKTMKVSFMYENWKLSFTESTNTTFQAVFRDAALDLSLDYEISHFDIQDIKKYEVYDDDNELVTDYDVPISDYEDGTVFTIKKISKPKKPSPSHKSPKKPSPVKERELRSLHFTFLDTLYADGQTSLTITNWIGVPLEQIFNQAIFKFAETYPYLEDGNINHDYVLVEKLNPPQRDPVTKKIRDSRLVEDYDQPIGNFKEGTVFFIAKMEKKDKPVTPKKKTLKDQKPVKTPKEKMMKFTVKYGEDKEYYEGSKTWTIAHIIELALKNQVSKTTKANLVFQDYELYYDASPDQRSHKDHSRILGDFTDGAIFTLKKKPSAKKEKWIRYTSLWRLCITKVSK